MKKIRIIAILVVCSLLISIVRGNGINVKTAGAETNTTFVDKRIEELLPGESTHGILGSIITCVEEENFEIIDEESTPVVDETTTVVGDMMVKYNTKYSDHNVQSEFCEESAILGKELNNQMENYLNDSPTGNKATVSTEIYDKSSAVSGLVTIVRFDISDLELVLDDKLMLWISDSICRYPSLGAFHTAITYSYSQSGDKKILTNIGLRSPIEANELKSVTKEYINRINSIIETPLNDDNMDDAEKILYVHDKLVNMGDYVGDRKAVRHVATGVVMDGKGVCQSYAASMNHALVLMGYDSTVVCSSNHAWNAIRLDGKWYYVDVTWDDPVGAPDKSFVGHDYILVQKSAFDDDHELDSDYAGVYGSIEYNFGSAYDTFFPKKEDINSGMWYVDGEWYYANAGNLYSWQGSGYSDSYKVREVSYDSNLCSVELNGKLFYSNSKGIFGCYDGIRKQIVGGNITDMYAGYNSIRYLVGNSGTEYIYVENIKPTETPMPTPTATATPSNPSDPTATVNPSNPSDPTATVNPSNPGDPTATVNPSNPGDPTATAKPSAPSDPTATVNPSNPSGPTATAKPAGIVMPIGTIISTTVLPDSYPYSGDTYDNTDTNAERQGSIEVPRLSAPILKSAKKGRLTIKINKPSNSIIVQARYGIGSGMKNRKVIRLKSTKTTVKKLKSRKKYYVQVRAGIARSDGKIVWGSWSKKKSKKIK